MPNAFNAQPILQELVTRKVDFVVVGGLAMVTHGSAYITDDLDICYCRSAENIARLATALAAFQPYLRGAPQGLPFRFDAATIAAGLNFTLVTSAGNVNVLGEISGIGDFYRVAEMSFQQEVFGLAIMTLSLDGLIAAKKAAGRTKDRVHLLELEELRKLDASESH